MPTPATTPMTGDERRRLKQLAHHLKPVVLLGQAGLTDAVLAEIELALDHHELIKVRINADGGDDQAALIAARTGAALVQRIGHVASLYRANPERAAVTAAPITESPAAARAPMRNGARPVRADDRRPARAEDSRPARAGDRRPARPGAVERRPATRFNGPRPPPNSRGRR